MQRLRKALARMTREGAPGSGMVLQYCLSFVGCYVPIRLPGQCFLVLNAVFLNTISFLRLAILTFCLFLWSTLWHYELAKRKNNTS